MKKAGRQSAPNNAESKEISSSGRIFIDVREAAQAQRQLRTYAFTEITRALLGVTSPWFSGQTIAAKLCSSSNGTAAGTAASGHLVELLRYSVGQAVRALDCVDAMNCVTEAATLARVTGQPLSSVWTRGKMLQAVNLLLRAAKQRGYLVPDVGTARDAQAQESPLVLSPEPGVYSDPICVLDFASLYPSLIIGYNMSFDSLLPPNALRAAGDHSRQSWPTHESVGLPDQHREYGFVVASSHKGVVPEILETLLRERQEVKAKIRNTRDPSMRVIYDLRQKALKIAANAFYGFLGATSSRLRCLPVNAP